MDPLILAQFKAQEAKLKELYESVKPTVWAVKITRPSKKKDEEDDEENHTAFAIHRDAVKKKGYLMTCGHSCFRSGTETKIHARRLNGTAGVEYKGTVVQRRSKIDASIIEVPLTDNDDFVVGKFGSGDLAVGEMIMAIGNPECLKGTCLIGRNIYPCTANPESEYNTALSCKKYKSRSALDTIQPVRLAGHLFNVASFKGMFKHLGEADSKCLKNYQANLPIIQCTGLAGGPGCSGGPIFNMKGEMIGMYVASLDDFQVGIHASYLKVFLDNTLKMQNEGLGM